jgi:hypothetical protein
VQQPRFLGCLELAAQIRDEDLDRVRRREGVVAPDLVEQALARDDDPLVAHQVLEELELALGQLDVALAAVDLVGVGVQAQIADAQRRAPARGCAAQQRADPGQQLLALERFDEIVVGAGVKAGDASLEGVAGGQHQDRDAVVATQLPRDLDAVDLRQPEVEDHHVGQECRRLVERGATVAREAYLVALQTQRPLQHVGDFAVVLDHEHAW